MSYFDKKLERNGTGAFKYDSPINIYKNNKKKPIILTIADMDFKTSKHIIKGFKKVSNFGVFGYMTTNYEPFFNSIKYYYKSNFDLDLENKNIIYSRGAITALESVIKIKTKENDKIALSLPIYGHFMEAIEGLKRVVIDVPLKENNGYFEFDFEKLEETLKDENIKMYILCSPENPIGRVWKKEELRKIIDICHKTNTLLISDEVHCDLVSHKYKHYPIFKVTDEVKDIVLINGIGKTFNLAGLQGSYMIIKDEELLNEIKSKFDCDINTFTLNAFLYAYTKKGNEYIKELNKYLDANFEFAYKFINENMKYIKVNKREGTYFLYLDFEPTKLSEEEIYNTLFYEASVILDKGRKYGKEKDKYKMRICLSLPKKELKEALTRIKEAFDKKVK